MGLIKAGLGALGGVFKRWKNFFGKFCKKPLALFLSSGIFLPVAGDEPGDAKRDFKLSLKKSR